jgi:tetratricopeptide (TPR) repeat protein
MRITRFPLLLLAGMFIMCSAGAQNISWPSPEVEQMYNKARELHQAGNLRQAITLYQQTIQLAPTVMVVHRELGKAYSLAGAYEEAEKTLEPIIKSGDGDEQSYQALGACYAALKEKKKAKNIFEKGIERYPHSGILFHEWGKMYDDDNDQEEALTIWLRGIEADPAYHLNYYDAARTYMYTSKPVWAVLYGEIFINMEQQTPRANETRTMLLKAYGRLFRSVAITNLPKYDKKNEAGATNSGFEEAVFSTFSKLSPVVSDGITTENLTMLRTRFIMDWHHQKYYEKYPFTLFSRHSEMIRDGYFDIYNQWLFGKAENAQMFEAWNKFHADAMPDMEEWLKDNPFRATAADAYNTKEVKDIFLKKR